MKKIDQLRWFQQHRIPTPAFESVTWTDFQARKLPGNRLRPPFAVRSTFSTEDADGGSMAGHFHSSLNVDFPGLSHAVGEVFESYPTQVDEEVIVQEMITEPISGGVLFAFRNREWKMEWSSQGPTAVVGGSDFHTLFLPPFSRLDYYAYRLLPFWKPDDRLSSFETRELIRLAGYVQQLLALKPETEGLDIEFVINRKGLWVLQARPITTPEEGEWVLTSANHKEILPPAPSRMMTGLMEGTGHALFDYYRKLDSSLPPYPFLVESGGMPWINLSALLRVMVEWGLPSNLVSRSVGATDYLKVGFRPHQAVRKIGVFFKVAWSQLTAAKTVNKWLKIEAQKQHQATKKRHEIWEQNPEAAFQAWCDDFQQLYVALVTHMQMLTGAMSGPVRLLEKLGIMPEGGLPSASTDFFTAFKSLQEGEISREDFLSRFGHRGFYESDIGQPRFREFTEDQWDILQANKNSSPETPTKPLKRLRWPVSMAWNLVQLRERVRQETMKHFETYRRELQVRSRALGMPEERIWNSAPEEWKEILRGIVAGKDLPPPTVPEPTGWDFDAFLANGYGRRIPLSGEKDYQEPICIFPGKVVGRAWRVKSAGLDSLENMPVGEDPIILVAEALDPGWIPYFSRVEGVVSKVGGVLSHASIILREAGLPAITQYSSLEEIGDGEWIEMDAKKGTVTLVSNHQPR